MIIRIDEEITNENYTEHKVKTILNASYIYINTKNKKIDIQQKRKSSIKEINIDINKNTQIRIWER